MSNDKRRSIIKPMGKRSFLSVTETAEVLNLTRQAVLARIKAGTLRAQKIGATYVVARKELARRKIRGNHV